MFAGKSLIFLGLRILLLEVAALFIPLGSLSTQKALLRRSSFDGNSV
jgi:hypothetical protein